MYSGGDGMHGSTVAVVRLLELPCVRRARLFI